MVRGLGGRHTRYQWERQVDSTWTAVAGATDSVYVLAAADTAAQGLYRTRATNDWVPGLTLYSKPVYAQATQQCPPLSVQVATAALTLPQGDAATLRAYPASAGTPVQWRDARGRVLATTAALTVGPHPDHDLYRGRDRGGQLPA